MIVAVTGATGYLGRLVVDGLLSTQQPGDIVAIVRDEAKAADLAAKDVRVRVAPYDDRASLERALRGVDRVLLVSGTDMGRRVAQHANVIDAARAAGVGYVAYTSAPGATTSALVVASEHRGTEQYLTGSGLAYTMLRNGWYTENYLPQVETARGTGAIVAAVGEGRVASATRADYADAAVAVLLGKGHEGAVYELSGDYAWSYGDLADAIGRLIGAPVVYQRIDTVTLVGILVASGLDRSRAEQAAALDRNIADGLLAGTSGDLSALIGRPTTPLLEGLRAAVP